MDDKEKTALYTKKQKNVIGKWMEQEIYEVTKLLRNEFMESGQVTDTTRQRLKEILEDKMRLNFENNYAFGKNWQSCLYSL